MFKRILLPVDSSENCDMAINYTIDIAKKFNSEVIVLHTFSMPLPEYIPFNFNTKDLEEELFNNCNKVIDHADNKLKNAGIKAKSYLKNGPAGFMITRTVENEGCDLVIMASRGLGTIKSFLIGSVTTYVLHHVKVPVFLIS